MSVDLRLAIPAAAGWIAAAVIIGVPNAALPALVVGWVAAGALALVRPRAALAAAAIALCCTSIAIHAPSRSPSVLVDAAAHHDRIDAVATATQSMFPGRGSFEVVLESVDGVSVSVPALVFGEGPTHRLGIGSKVSLTATVVATEPGDDRAFLLFPDEPPTLRETAPWYLEWANGLRTGLLGATQQLPGDGGDLLSGLAIGDTSAVSAELDSAMKASSLSHLTAVSGANCAIVIGLVMLAGGALGFPRWLRVAASILMLLAFVVLVTPEPSVLRAAVMATLVLVALLGGRPARGLPILSLATLALLVIDPWLARNYGFVLSVLATAGLLLLAGPLARALERWLPRWLALVIAVPIAAQLACQPVIILLNASLPTYGVAANILAAPAAPVATIVGLAACVALILVPPLGTLLCQLAWLPSAWIAAVATFFAAAPGAQLPWPQGIAGVMLLVGTSACAVTAVLGRGSWRRWSTGAIVLIAVVYLGVVSGARVAQQWGRPADWQIAGCDVGQGDAFIVRSEGAVALIDTGPDPVILTTCLDNLGIDHIDLLVLTHYHLDHVGGVKSIIGMVDQVIVGPTGNDADERVIDDLRAGGATVQQLSRGPSGMLGDLRWHILWPPSHLAGIEIGNPSSVVVEFEPVGECHTGCLSSLFLGDVDQRAQQRILATNPLGQVDVVKVAHHGSADQEPLLYERAQATVGLIGVGVDNGYGHPADTLLTTLGATATIVERTDERGLILLAPGKEPGEVTVWTEH